MEREKEREGEGGKVRKGRKFKEKWGGGGSSLEELFQNKKRLTRHDKYSVRSWIGLDWIGVQELKGHY